jgi:hypothetical protein
MQKPIDYKDFINLGGVRDESGCPVFQKQFGYSWFWADIELGKGYIAHWDCVDRLVEIQKTKKGSILSRLPVKDLDHLKELVAFFTGNQKDEEKEEVEMKTPINHYANAC